MEVNLTQLFLLSIKSKHLHSSFIELTKAEDSIVSFNSFLKDAFNGLFLLFFIHLLFILVACWFFHFLWWVLGDKGQTLGWFKVALGIGLWIQLRRGRIWLENLIDYFSFMVGHFDERRLNIGININNLKIDLLIACPDGVVVITSA